MRIGFTTTIPVEVILAAGHVPVDLNNLFISAADRNALLARAEKRGIPVSTCSWIKGIYASVMAGEVDSVIAVVEGDCSNTSSLAELLEHEGVRTIPFRYPRNRDRAALREQIESLCQVLGTTIEQAEARRNELMPIRKRLDELDRLSWSTHVIPYSKVRNLQLASSDFLGSPMKFEARLDTLEQATGNAGRLKMHAARIAIAGVPTSFDDLLERVRDFGGEVMLDEMPRQFSMPFFDAESIVDQYLAYTYPYDIFHRARDLKEQIQRRRIHGLVHYIQAFCHRQIEDIVLRDLVEIPTLTIEGDRPGPLDQRSGVRLQAFLEMLT
ncbi:MAG: 2-hydroxyacyl-CoA dehydratase [Deltaproteobacteria bacterium]|nr:2-hydroxyacyl-CoA dehydratase [Deltaproteobacteria bacterium]